MVYEYEGVEYDHEREQYLSGLDITTLRFWNSDVRGNLEQVLQKIRSVISSLLPRSGHSPLA